MASAVHIPETVSLGIHALAKLAGSRRRTETLGNLLVKPGSVDHLSKVMQKLARAGIVRSRRGRGGGFSLAVSPFDIRLMDIWIALEGTFVNNTCPYSNHGCKLVRCLFGSSVEEASDTIRTYLMNTTVADLGRIIEGEQHGQITQENNQDRRGEV